MRLLSLLALLAALTLTAPAFAGTLTLNDGRGNWQSTRCTPPPPPSAFARNPEEAADNLNAQTALHNRYAEAAQAYMTCLSQEAQGDSEAGNQMIARAAQNLIQQTQNQVNASAERLRAKTP
ncbi:MAG: hypothetical protein HGA90_07685 [Alphaproteobacteria bacterium]|nr:hypothetical protein [Alphaproteobacteria bacterium]